MNVCFIFPCSKQKHAESVLIQYPETKKRRKKQQSSKDHETNVVVGEIR